MSNIVLFSIFGASSPIAYIALAIVAFLLFGNRLPSVMRSLGRSVTEFKRGVNGIEEEVDDAVRTSENKKNSKSGDEAEG
jgi:sec-independent protein translocase protein TatA